MRIKTLIIIYLSFVLSFNLFAEMKNVFKSDLKSATVFFKGAELSHKSSVNLNKGENEIYIDGLSPNIDVNSLKVKASGGAIISSYEFSVDYLKNANQSSIAAKKILDSINVYEQKINAIKTESNINENLINLLQKGIDKNVDGSETGLSVDELMKMMKYYETKSTELYSAQSEHRKNLNSYETTLARLRKQYNQETRKNDKNSGVLKLTLTSPMTTGSTLDITYYTPYASWVPYYDINVESTDKPIHITSRSKVKQTTGLDWNKIKLTLSTATPSNGKVAPLFTAWFLENMRPTNRSYRDILMVQNSFSYSRSDMNTSSADAYREIDEISAEKKLKSIPIAYIVDGNFVDENYVSQLDESMIKDNQFLDGATAQGIYGSNAAGGVYIITLKNSMDDYVNISDNEMNMVYEIDLPYTIPGNGKEQAVDLKTYEISAEYKYYCAPKLDPETFLLAEISDWEKLNLLTGKANITYDGTYVGQTLIDANSTHKKLTLTLGTDKRVSVKRERMKDFSSTKMFDSSKKQVFTYRITVKNNQNKPIKLVLKDQYPLSTQKNIEVELLTKETTPWTANIEDIGVITWEEDFSAGESKVYKISYSVKYPKDSNLNL